MKKEFTIYLTHRWIRRIGTEFLQDEHTIRALKDWLQEKFEARFGMEIDDVIVLDNYILKELELSCLKILNKLKPGEEITGSVAITIPFEIKVIK